ncbi:hypothetical protein [Gluconobacter cerinus]|uniref:hypothetical protein n=1 Tax=Gluconobacter cerinus TaxID=38307 RepID=UPI001B8D4AEB|nr:hypothetical protein [Gluconobacter cerinus]MBS0994719.1 hypothetical protein [Gluconobacter cerinus]
MGRSYVKRSDEEWREILHLYSIGSTINSLVKKYGVSESAITKHAKEAGIRKTVRLKPHRPKAPTGTPIPVISTASPSVRTRPLDADETIAAITSAKLSTLARADAISRLIDETTIALVAASACTEPSITARTLDMLTGSLSRLWQIQRSVLAVDKANASIDQVLPQLPIREMTDIEVKRIRWKQEQEAQGAEFDDEGNLITDQEPLFDDSVSDDNERIEECGDDYEIQHCSA